MIPTATTLAFVCSIGLFPAPVPAIHAAQAVPDEGRTTGVEVDTLIEGVAARLDDYRSRIRDITAREVKTITVFDASGLIERRRTIVSDISVHPVSGNNDDGVDRLFEYHDVRSVDGRDVADRTQRRDRLNADVEGLSSPEEEFARIAAESGRYDLGLVVSGYFIDPHYWLRAQHHAFAFHVVGSETVGGRVLLVVDYRQVAPTTPPLALGFASIPETRSTMEGRVWVDTESFEIRKSEWRGMVDHDSFPEPVLMIRIAIEHGDAQVPVNPIRSVLYQAFLHGRVDDRGGMEANLSAEVRFEYDQYETIDATGVVLTDAN